jgi:hypothetical protein
MPDDKYKKYGIVKAGKKYQPGGSLRPKKLVTASGEEYKGELYQYPKREKKSGEFNVAEDDLTITTKAEATKSPGQIRAEKFAEYAKKALAEKNAAKAKDAAADSARRKKYAEMMGKRK